MKEIYKFENVLSGLLIDEMFQVLTFYLTVRLNYGTYILTDIKDAMSLSIFKEKIKSWHCNNCQCRLCKIYIVSIVFFLTYILQNLAHGINLF